MIFHRDNPFIKSTFATMFKLYIWDVFHIILLINAN